MLAVRLNDETERRLDALAARTGRTKTFYAREAIEAHLDELEDSTLPRSGCARRGGRGSPAVTRSRCPRTGRIR